MSGLHDSESTASQALLTAALGGLLCLVAACGDSVEAAGPDGCAEGVVDTPQITASEVVADLSLETFTAECNERKGTVEVHPHCGGVNGCRGISYDSDTDTRTEHSCRGANTCTGFSCIVCD